VDGPAWQIRAAVWLWLSVPAALLAIAGSVVGLADVDGIYGKETREFIDQAIAQDVVNLAVVAPAVIGLALFARRGSLPAYLAWLGTLAFTVYNYVIYAFSIHVGPLFLAWVVVLGLSLYALIGGLAVLDPDTAKARCGHPPRMLAGWFLIVVAVLFALLWLRDIIPAMLSGDAPEGARELALPSSPVHVLDLSFFLPAALTTGILLLRRRAWAYLTAPGLLVFLALTGLPILATPFIADARGDTAGWAVLAPVGVVTVASLTLLGRLLRTAVSQQANPPPRGDTT
jgi:hypothetical protein